MPNGNKKNLYITLIICFLTIFFGLGFCSSSRSIFLAPITDALNISRSQFSLNETIRFSVTALISMFFGDILSKLGRRYVILVGLLCYCLSSLLFAFAETIFAIYIAGAFLGIGTAFGSTAIISSIIKNSFGEKAGVINGVILSANGIASALASQIYTPIIYSSIFGYKKAYIISALLVGITFFATLFLFRENPSKATTEKSVTLKTDSSENFKLILRNAKFYLLIIFVFLTGFALQGITGIAAAHMVDTGVSPKFSGIAFSVFSFVLGFSKILIGFINDKFGVKISALLCHCCSITALLMLGVLEFLPHKSLISIFYALFAGIAVPLETIMLPFFSGGIFGYRFYDKIVGILVGANYIGSALSLPVLNMVFDIMGSYTLIILILCITMFFITIGFQIMLNLRRDNYEGTNDWRPSGR